MSHTFFISNEFCIWPPLSSNGRIHHSLRPEKAPWSFRVHSTLGLPDHRSCSWRRRHQSHGETGEEVAHLKHHAVQEGVHAEVDSLKYETTIEYL